jgi:hypothetical protein
MTSTTFVDDPTSETPEKHIADMLFPSGATEEVASEIV